uniref:non-specific serine/threonine protein kinase n=1 Tax=Timema monikensis TaxID=170555 RepID=A0A7R9E9C6_9NEOP|nr:unnamed protein product [Timema monikensis]
MEKPKEDNVKVDGRRKRSKVWAYFEEGNGDATCMHCSKKLKRPTGTTSTLKNHLSRHHITLYEEFLKLDAVSKDASLASTSALKSSPKQQTLISMVKKKEELPPQGKEAKAISGKIAQMLALCHLPYQFVEERGFKELMAHIKPNYRIPVSTTFSRNIVPLLYQSEKKMLASVLIEDIVAAQLNTISLTTDNWTSRAGDDYASLTCHYSRDFKYKSFTLANVVVLESHTAVNIRHTLSEMCKYWCIPPPTQSSPIKVFIVTDNARNLQAAINGTYWIRRQCFAHTLQLAIKDAKTACPNITQIISKSRAIVGHYSRSSTANARLHAVQKTMDLPALKLIQDVETRWSSEYAMLDRLVCLRKAVAAELASSNSDIDSLSSTEWKLAGGIVEVMRPFAEASTEACGNAYPTASMIIPILHCLEATTLAHIQKNELVSAVPFARSLLKSLKSRFPLYKMDEINALCTIVDPRYKAALFNEEERFHAINLLRQELLSYVAPETQANEIPKPAVLTGSMWDELDKVPLTVDLPTNSQVERRNGWINVGDLQGAVHFKIVKYERIKFLVIALKDSIEIYAWAPKPYHKFMAFKSFGDLAHRPLLVDLTVEEGTRLKVIYGSADGFHAVDLDSASVYDIYLPKHTQGPISPHCIVPLPNSNGMQLLLCYDNEGVYVNTYGKVSKNIVLQWGEMPTSVAYIGTGQIMGWGNKAIEIRSVETGHLDGVFMHKKSQKLKFLCERNDKVGATSLECWTFDKMSPVLGHFPYPHLGRVVSRGVVQGNARPYRREESRGHCLLAGVLLVSKEWLLLSDILYDPQQARDGQLVMSSAALPARLTPLSSNGVRLETTSSGLEPRRTVSLFCPTMEVYLLGRGLEGVGNKG